jgi:hypothetical protein
MSAWLVSCTHIRALVSAAVLRDRHDQLPVPDWAALATRYPEAFGHLIDSAGRPKEYATGRGWRHHCENELGRALWLANVDSIAARYPPTESTPGDGVTRYPDMWPEGGIAEVAAYRHALVEFPVVATIKAAHCFEYQSCDVSNWDESWAAKFCEKLVAILIPELPGYEAAPWGIDDPEDGPPVPGTAGAPVSLMSLIPR